MNDKPGLNILGAIAKFRELCPNIEKTKVNPHFKSKYASLGEIVAVIGPVLKSCDLIYLHIPDGDGGLRCVITHTTSGESIEGVFPLRVAKSDAQGVGGLYTYACRYLLVVMLGIPVGDDNDGNAEGPLQTKALKKALATTVRLFGDYVKKLSKTEGLSREDAEFKAVKVVAPWVEEAFGITPEEGRSGLGQLDLDEHYRLQNSVVAKGGARIFPWEEGGTGLIDPATHEIEVDEIDLDQIKGAKK